MPIGRRSATRSSTVNSPGSASTATTAGSCAFPLKSSDSVGQPQSTTVSSPIRHEPFPSLPSANSIVVLILHCGLFAVATMVQYLNLYKTVWWIPESSFNYAIDFSAIDYHALAHILIMGLTPSLYRIFLTVFSGPLSAHPILRLLGGIPLFAGWLFLAVHTALHVDMAGYTWFYSVYLYALLLYFPILAFLLYNVDRLTTHLCFRINFAQSKRSRKSCTPSVSMFHGALTKFKQMGLRLFWLIADWPALKPTSFVFPVRYLTLSSAAAGTDSLLSTHSYHYCVEPNSKSALLLRHQCLNTSAEQIREEIALFRRDFNARLMDVLFRASYTTYYSCIVPVLLLKSDLLVYDIPWCIQHGLVTWLATVLLFWYYHLPADYLDMLHRSALHLGRWAPEDARSVPGQVYACWSPVQVYTAGTLIKHVRGQFQAVEVNNAAEPGNVQHTRFHFLFHSPLRVASLLMYTSLAIPLVQLLSLKWISEWYKLIGIAAMGVFGLYNHYIHIRTYSVLRRVYHTAVLHSTKSVG